MSDNTKIEWTDATWNPVVGCTKVSAGCDNCYAIRTAHRMQANPNPRVSAAYARTEADGEWTGRVNLLEDKLDMPLRWRKPRRIFVNAQSDLFHADVPDEFIARVWAVMALAPQHTFQILTKRHGRMRALLKSDDFRDQFGWAATGISPYWTAGDQPWPLPNVWLGVSVEDQKTADLRIPALLDTPAAVLFLSCEPLLGPLDLTRWVRPHESPCEADGSPPWCICDDPPSNVDWVIVGGESGPGARPMHSDWARSLRDQCVTAGVPFMFKQWGEWIETANGTTIVHADGETTTARIPLPAGAARVSRVGKKTAGRSLDGRLWDEYPGGTDG